MRSLLGAVLLGGLVASGAAASERTEYRTIAAGNFAEAAQRLEAERRIHPQRPELMLNLAAAYSRMGRVADARALYQEVLARPVAMMDLASGAVVSSHDVAALGQSRLAQTIAAR
jgi:thioredoxin-like negative regulator of GroEL